MKRALPFLLLVCMLCSACSDKITNVTNNNGPEDWQPPVLTWLTPPEADVRGTVGIDVSVTDSSFISSVRLYLDGIENQFITETPFRFEIHTDSLTDGVHLLEARAWDEFNNMGVSPILRMNVANTIVHGPHVIWVPDSFATIQSAINASTDYDTIRVRDGIYYETLNLFGKGIWVESEHGPLHCAVDDAGANNAFLIAACQVPATVRGFWMVGSGYLIYMTEGAQAEFYNNVIESDSADGLLIALNAGGCVVNNLFMGSRTSVQLAYFWGTFFNNILEDAEEFAFWDASLLRNPVVYGYDLFWNNAEDYAGFPPAETDIHAEPLLDLVLGFLANGSPAIDAGNPQILDRNETRSDIGPFGGPLAYYP